MRLKFTARLASVSLLMLGCLFISFSMYRLIHTDSANSTQGKGIVVIAGYQRSGSTFLAELFNQNSKVFHWFEPVDVIYSSLYGTGLGWNVPSDIWNFRNGSRRIIPEFEKRYVVETLGNLMTCNIDKVPTLVLLGSFIEGYWLDQKHTQPFYNCVGHDILETANACHILLKPHCGTRFNPNRNNFYRCAYFWNLTEGMGKPIVKDDLINYITDTYPACMQRIRTRITPCLKTLRRLCSLAEVRSFKTVRLSMEMIRTFQSSYPGSRVIHSMRDPRAIVNSRTKMGLSFHSLYSLKNGVADFAKEGRLLCGNLRNDLALLTKSGVGILNVLHRNLALKPVQTTNVVYRKLGLERDEWVQYWLINNTSQNGKRWTSRNSSATVEAWKRTLSPELQNTLEKYCSDVIGVLDSQARA